MARQDVLEAPPVAAEGRFAIPASRYGLSILDHTAIPVHDPEHAARFVMDVLGGVIHHSLGYGPDERAGVRPEHCTDPGAPGRRVQHIFLHVGTTLVQVGYPHDGTTFSDPLSGSEWPHWAFGVSPDGLEACTENLRRHRIPFLGPLAQEERTSVYFCDPDGNKMEFVTWTPAPRVRARAVDGAAPLDWRSLLHLWRPAEPLVLADNVRPSGGRWDVPSNRYGITGVDHFAVPVSDPARSARFAADVLGGTVFRVSEVDGAGRSTAPFRTYWVHVGHTLMQLGYPQDGPRPGQGGAGAYSESGWPHWAFQTTVEDMDRFCGVLRERGVPCYGPTMHGRAASVYFLDPDGNKLEIATGGHPYPPERSVNPSGPQELDGAFRWQSLLYRNWRMA